MTVSSGSWIGPPGFPRRWKDLELDRQASLVPDSVVVRALDPKGVVSGVEVGVGGSVDRTDVDPVVIEAFELVHVAVLLGCGVIQRREFEGYGAILVAELDLLDGGQGFPQRHWLI